METKERTDSTPALKSIWQNAISETGAVLAVLAILFFISFQLLEVIEPTNNPYTGLWTFLVLPLVMIVGLILIPLGYFKERSRRRRLFPSIKDWPRFPHIDLNSPGHRRAFTITGLTLLVVIPLIGISSYQGYHYTDSTAFCGQVCHSVMHPEYTCYLGSPHARVSCAACHIGPGASWYVKSKISGVRQVLAVTFNTFSRPIHTPIKDLRPARETCEQCHWPEKFFGAQLRTRVHYASDEKNTRHEIRVLVKTGGADSSMGPASGIHWHMALSHKIEYIASDSHRQVIPWVKSTDPSGKESIYRSDDKTSQDPPPPGEKRTIDCVDCHNRPTHIIQPPERAVNISLETGRISRDLPYSKKIAVEALTVPYSTGEEADAKIATYIRDAYQKLDPRIAGERKSDINQTIDEVRAIYRRNFFPLMRVDWRTYPDNIGHMIFNGCFRCHDGKHISNDKGPIRRDCSVCHEFQQPLPLAEAPNAFQQITPEHPYKLEGIHAQLNCSSCHSGGRAPVASCEGCHTIQSQFRGGKSPLLPGMKVTPPVVMADLACDSCHDLSKPSTTPVSAQCETCHEKGYGEMVQTWKSDAQTSRAKASAAIEDLRKSLGSGRPRNAQEQSLQQLVSQLQGALEQVDRAGPQHNTELADAVYQQIIKLATESKKQ
jgi:hypothetical protein